MIRKAMFAGTWYPADAGACEKKIQSFLRTMPWTPDDRTRVGAVVPHAGWDFSGKIACNTIRRLQASDVDAIVVFGMHLHAQSSRYMMGNGAWETPFGALDIDEALAEALAAKFSFIQETASNFTMDNTIELQLPFIKYFFSQARILPLGVPPAEQTLEIARSVVDLAKHLGRKIKVIGSTDLTHYGAHYGFTGHGSGPEAVQWVLQNDRRVIDLMLELDARQVIAEARTNHNACCSGAAAAALEAGRRMGAVRAELVSYATSNDVRPSSNFVGYAGIVF